MRMCMIVCFEVSSCEGVLQRSLSLPLLLFRTSTPTLNQPSSTLSHHPLLLFLLDELLLIAQRQSIRDSKQKHTRREHPQTLSGVIDGRRRRGDYAGRHARDPRAGFRRDDVAQGDDAVVQAFVDVAGFRGCVVGDLGVYVRPSSVYACLHSVEKTYRYQ